MSKSGCTCGGRSADALELGATHELPAPGAPEPIGNYIQVGSLGGCGCAGGYGDTAAPTMSTAARVGYTAAAALALSNVGPKVPKPARWGLAAFCAYKAIWG